MGYRLGLLEYYAYMVLCTFTFKVDTDIRKNFRDSTGLFVLNKVASASKVSYPELHMQCKQC